MRNEMQMRNLKKKSKEVFIPIYTPYTVDLKHEDKSSPYKFGGPLQLKHGGGIADVRLFAPSAVDSKYCFLAIELFILKTYAALIIRRLLLRRKRELFIKI